VPAVSDLAAYNEISAANFTLDRLVFGTRLFRVVVHHRKVQFIRIEYYLFSYDVAPLITKLQLHTATCSLHHFSGDKFSSKLPVQIATKKCVT